MGGRPSLQKRQGGRIVLLCGDDARRGAAGTDVPDQKA